MSEIKLTLEQSIARDFEHLARAEYWRDQRSVISLMTGFVKREGDAAAAEIVRQGLPLLLQYYREANQRGVGLGILGDLLPALISHGQGAAVGETFVDDAIKDPDSDPFRSLVHLLIRNGQAPLVAERGLDSFISLWREGTDFGYKVAQSFLTALGEEGYEQAIRQRLLPIAIEFSKSGDQAKIKRSDEYIEKFAPETIKDLWAANDPASHAAGARLLEKSLKREGEYGVADWSQSTTAQMLGPAFENANGNDPEKKARGRALLASIKEYCKFEISRWAGNLLFVLRDSRSDHELYVYNRAWEQTLKPLAKVFSNWRTAAGATTKRVFLGTKSVPAPETADMLRMVRAWVDELKEKRDRSSPIRRALNYAISVAESSGLAKTVLA